MESEGTQKKWYPVSTCGSLFGGHAALLNEALERVGYYSFNVSYEGRTREVNGGQCPTNTSVPGFKTVTVYAAGMSVAEAVQSAARKALP